MNPMKTTVIYHRADFDGLFCREIARKFLPDAELIGWDFGDEPIDPATFKDVTYILDLPVDRVIGLEFPGKGPKEAKGFEKIIWIDHHKSSIESHPQNIPGYRIDGVAACRLAWQWFTAKHDSDIHLEDFEFPPKQDFIDRTVLEPLAVRLAGEYDIWDKRDPRAELFQHGLRSRHLSDADWSMLLTLDRKMSVSEIEALMDVGHHKDLLAPDGTTPNPIVLGLLESGKVIQFVREQEYAEVIKDQGFDLELHGLKFLACCSHECDIRSHLFAAGIKPHHDALFGFTFTGKDWRVSLYHAPGKEHHDLSVIAKLYGGGGHRGACGFRTKSLPFIP